MAGCYRSAGMCCIFVYSFAIVIFSTSEYEYIGHSQSLENPNQHDSNITIYGYSGERKRTMMFHLLCVLFFGIPYCLFYWYPQYRVMWLKKCSLSNATIILGMLIFLFDIKQMLPQTVS